MAILGSGEPPAKRRRLVVDVSEQGQVEQHIHHHVDHTTTTLDALMRDLAALSPWEIVTAGPSLYRRLHAAATAGIAFLRDDVATTRQRTMIYQTLLRHLEICLSWTAGSADECDDADLYVQAVTSIVNCLEQIYAPELDNNDDVRDGDDDDDDDGNEDEEDEAEAASSSSTLSLLFRALGFLLQEDPQFDVDAPSTTSRKCPAAVESILQIVRFRLVAATTPSAISSWYGGGANSGLATTMRQLDILLLLVRCVHSQTAVDIVALLAQSLHEDATTTGFAQIALETISQQPHEPPPTIVVNVTSASCCHPQTRTEALFAWQCRLVAGHSADTNLFTTMVNTLRKVLLPEANTPQQSDRHHLRLQLDRTLALDCLVRLSSQRRRQPASDDEDDEDDDDYARALLRQLVLDLLSKDRPQQLHRLRLSTACAAVTALQNLLLVDQANTDGHDDDDDDDGTLFAYFDALHDRQMFLSVLLRVGQPCHDDGDQQHHLFWQQEQQRLWHGAHRHDVAVWAMELFWTFVSVAIRGEETVDNDDDTSTDTTIADLALSAIDDGCRSDEYKLYLAARTICRDHPVFFQTRSSDDDGSSARLVTALSVILRDAEASTVTKNSVIAFFRTLVRASNDNDASLHICQDRDVLDVIAQMGATGENDEASKLLFDLSDQVPNRLRLVRRPRVLFAMMRFAQRQQQQQGQPEQNDSEDQGRYYQRRIGQLAELL